MKMSIRVGLVAAAATVALAFTGSAFATFSPKLWAANVNGVTIKVSVGATDDPTAKVTIYAPLGYTLKDPAPNGTKLGSITAHAQAGDLGGAILPLTGDLIAADPTAFTGPPNNVCSPGLHAQVWMLNLTAVGQTLQVPMYVDPTSGGEATFSSFKIQVCLPPPDVPAGTPGRATFGAKLLDAEFGTLAVNPATSSTVWHSLWTPYNPGVGTVNAAATVEAQAKVRSATVVTLAGKKSAKKAATLSAKVSADGAPVAGATVRFTAGGKVIATKKTGATGVATLNAALRKKTTFKVVAIVPDTDLGSAGCAATIPGSPVPCVDATVKGATATSKAVTVKP